MNERQKPEGPKVEGSVKDKISEKLEDFKKSDKLEGLYSFAKSNTRDTIAYVLLAIGVIWFFFQSFYGGAIVGLVAGVYFSDAIMGAIYGCNSYAAQCGSASCLTIIASLIVLFFSLPGFFIGAAISVGLKQLFIGNK